VPRMTEALKAELLELVGGWADGHDSVEALLERLASHEGIQNRRKRCLWWADFREDRGTAWRVYVAGVKGKPPPRGAVAGMTVPGGWTLHYDGGMRRAFRFSFNVINLTGLALRSNFERHQHPVALAAVLTVCGEWTEAAWDTQLGSAL